ncbi:MAG: glycosyltransferase family 2 protein [Chloroflexi bacterium]|nr:glycosyltransferase family 2 protein [Chloroflexota bacterium]
MLVSVVIPAYNEERYLPGCLAALGQVEHADFNVEVIVVDDGSTDHTGAIATSYGARVIRQPNGGVARARQAGFQAARGEIIASTDADTAPAADWLTRIVAGLGHDPRRVAIHGSVRVLNRSHLEDSLIFNLGMAFLGLNLALKRPSFSGANFAVRRSAWLAAGGFDTSLASAEDLDLSCKLQRIGRIVLDPQMVVFTSDRRLREGYTEVFKHSMTNYVRVAWLHRTALPFTNIR